MLYTLYCYITYDTVRRWGLKVRWLHPGRGGPGFPTAPDCYFVAERQGRLRPPRRQVGLALFSVRGYLTLNEILVFDLSLAIWSIRTNHLRGSSYGYPGVVVSAEALRDVSD